MSGVLSTAAYIPYIVSTVRRKTKPHPFSWLLWGILGAVSLVTYYAVGARESLPLAIVSFVGPSLLFILSLKYWEGTFSTFDYFCLAFSLVAIVVYILFHKAALALSINLFGDFLAALPTLRKVYRNPESENFWTWFLFSLSALTALASLKSWSYGLVILPLYLLVFEGTMSVLSFRGRLKK